MKLTRVSLPSPLVLASSALVLSVLDLVLALSGILTAAGTGLADGVPGIALGPVLLRILLVVSPAVLLALAVAVMLRRARPAHRVAPWLSALFASLASVVSTVFAASFAAGFRAADAGTDAGWFGALAWPSALVGALLAGLAIATAVAVALSPVVPARRRSAALVAPIRILVPAAAGIVGAVPIFLAVTAPSMTALAAFGIVLGLVISSASGSRRRASFSAPAVVRTESDLGRLGGVWSYGVAAVLIVTAVWAAGIAAGIVGAGTDIATTAMGLAGAGAQLAAIPLIIGVALIGRTQSGQSAWFPLLPVPLAALVISVAIQLLAYDVSGRGVLIGGIVAGLGLGAWVAAGLAPRIPGTLFARLVVGTAIVAGTGLVWFALVVSTGGIVLVLGGAALLLVGRGLTRRAAIA